MFESKYNKVLTIILIVVVVAIIGLLGFLGYDMYQKASVKNDAKDFVETFEGTTDVSDTESDNNTPQVSNEIMQELTQISEQQQGGTASTTKERPLYKGYGVVGTISIPKIKLDYPILEDTTATAMEYAPTFLTGVGINEVGNSVIIGHNYRNGVLFSNIKNLENGDKIYITDNAKNKLTYTIYSKFEATPSDTSFYQRDTNGKPEITLSTCTDNGKMRTIILARAE